MKNLKFYEAMEKEVNSWRASAPNLKVETDYVIVDEGLEIALVTFDKERLLKIEMLVYVFENNQLLKIADLMARCKTYTGVCELPMMDIIYDKYKGKDVGTAMVNKLKTIAKAKGLHQLETDALKGSEGFYEKMGLKPKPKEKQVDSGKIMMSMELGKKC